MMRKLFPIMATALLASGCSAGADRAAAEAGVAQFHQMVEAGRYHDIYVNAADDFRRSGPEAEGTRFLQMIHDRLGAVRSTSSTGWRVNFTPGGSTVSLDYNTVFASGPGTENFIFRIANNNAQLVGYHVNSPALVGSAAPATPATSASGKPSDAATPASAVGPAPVVAVEPPKPAEPPPPPAPPSGK